LYQPRLESRVTFTLNMRSNNLFSEFTPSTKSEWLAKIDRDLKGRSVEELNWQLPNLDGDSLSISPFAHAADLPVAPEPLVGERTTNAWDIGENITVGDDMKAANALALTGLMGGVNAPCFVFDDNFPSETQLNTLLTDIELDYISIFFKEQTENRSPLTFLKTLKNKVEKEGKNAFLLRGGIFYDPFADGRFDVVSATEIVKFAAENCPDFSVLSVNAERFFTDSTHVAEELFQALKSGEMYLNKLTDKGLDIKTVNAALTFRFQMGVSYFVEIAKLRAFKILWGNVLAAYDCPPMPSVIFASTTDKTFVADPHTNKIRSTTQAMSAVIGGATQLTLQPTEDSDFGRRIARNVQHLMTMESYLDKVVDPSAGSYYIETLTNTIAEAVWEKFQGLR
jgi:methylmalonyl-CoA mutase